MGKNEDREKNLLRYIGGGGGRKLLGSFRLNQVFICHLYMEEFFLIMEDVEMMSNRYSIFYLVLPLLLYSYFTP